MNYIFLAAALVLTAILIPILIPLLKRMKFGQTIREEGPESHLIKTGTPTMGGLSFISVTIILSVIGLLFVDDIYKLLVLIIVTVGFGLIGFIDDYIIVVKKDNAGLSSKQKFLAQIAVAVIIFIIMTNWIPSIEAGIQIPGTGLFIPLGIFFVVWIVFWLVGFSNAVNLTDGLDGLSTGTSIIAFGAFLVISLVTGETEVALFLFILIGSLIGFLIYNKYPAKLFMGDTGSLALGGIIATVSILLNSSLLLLVIGIVFVIETASVMMQVASYKTTGKRIFKMTPIHHHFELSGWNEWKIVIVFWSAGLLAGILGVILGVM
ncbi:phospho-N-acetylmuramoyl-pentapeptide-transferase [Jeotgalicoccus coquinae]|uniref:Phospho-N-acetylmuramoyl-pentapeptide-transferase n=1 Tax=Jeotgalicoccus coquinae TaxID=709509 RepID=A0A6V7RJD3_9STAP|nr:phospho-N-acetylmuramoyl-pentapeptide-transferase [Jeotgalicoccus coquinae]MBB6422533.1 phospho-N-acetylmuramoyl-pentapeptide-transferase [Jeotgalicoccus coquinae]GGE15138.1 phospho-N-acetylmuramoyl-pentapeptide-transferase [Jeotgalicoccus coquinae]CAD2078209.1 Phospho-N-acetylmuramoyl-pentapeptide-transferase [Jeotgalicoccus coquinae]